ncbi:hypothetical protein [Rhodococcus sp. IEGM 1408]|uniref:hypothetical protein n=1 Tax=Rhodococcus sp. IEGM 1408 TaxID=3082220 RepID=UPI002955D362|nr:hypothetical protein [Rhodococcus sp. IEGM 1408]MDV8002415.1 hypothetical protein [Rhodococcus sp. IEGM 1408]
MPTPDPTPASSCRAHEDHLRSLGLPQMIVPSTRLREILQRSAGASAGLAVAATGLAALDRANDMAVLLVERVGEEALGTGLIGAANPIVVLLLLALGLIAAAPLVGWLVAWLVRRASWATGTLLGLASAIALLVVAPIAFEPHDGPTLRTTAPALAGVLVGTYLGAGSLVRWAARRVRRELGSTGHMVARVLPVLMLAVLFLFFNAEIWQVMVALSWPRTFAVLAVMGSLTVLLVAITTRDDLQHELAVRAPGRALRVSERINILLVPVLTTLIQAVLFGSLVFAFFLFLGWIAIPEATETRWTLRPTEDLGGLLSRVPVSITLLRVSLVLAAFAALNLAASAASDAAHRKRFVHPMIDEVVHGLAAREAYLRARRRRG